MHHLISLFLNLVIVNLSMDKISKSFQINDRVGNLSVIGFYLNPKTMRVSTSNYLCRCICGKEVIKKAYFLNLGKYNLSCGCMRRTSQKKERNSTVRQFNDLSGQKFGFLTVIKRVEQPKNKKNGVYYMCRCVCGNEITRIADKIKCQKTPSCGCYNSSTHNGSKDAEYKIWNGIKQRCLNPNTPAYEKYKNRGVCDEWLIYENFIKDMGKRPSLKHTIERIDNNIGYCKDNCKWATRIEQQNNMCRNINIEMNGEIKTIAEWARKYNVEYRLLQRRIKNKWDLKDALERPKLNQSKSPK